MQNNELIEIILESLILKNKILSYRQFFNSKAVQIKTYDSKIINILLKDVSDWYVFKENR